MPEVWLPYGDKEVSLKLKREQIDDHISVKLPEPYREDFSIKYYLTDGSSTSEKIAKEMFPEAKPLLSFNDDKEEVVDGYLFRYSEALKDTLLVCAVRLDPLYWFTGPHSLIAKIYGLDDEVIKRKEKIMSCEEDGGVWFAKRLVEVSSPKAFCYFGRSGVSLSGDAVKVYERLKSFFSSNAQRHKKKGFVIASVGGEPYDDSLSEALYSSFGLLQLLDEGSDLLLLASCSKGLGDKGLRSYILKKEEESLTVKVLKALQEKSKVHMVTALPFTYLKRLGISGYNSLTEAFEAINKKAFIIENAQIYCKK